MTSNPKSDKKLTDKPSWDEVLKGLQSDYLIQVADRLPKISLLVAAKDWKTSESEFHKLKGTGKTYGFEEVSTICRLLEAQCQKSEPVEHFLELGLKLLRFCLENYKTKTKFKLEDQIDFKTLEKMETL
jgi:HPt (histidine-containing phosphotransfer) domain-containing protein